MGLIFDVLAAPVALPARGLMFIFNKIVEQVNNEMLDDSKVRMQLLELQALLDSGEITEEEFYEAEEELLDHLDAILEFKENQQQRGVGDDDDDEDDDEYDDEEDAGDSELDDSRLDEDEQNG
jgi:hypothetical protein